MTEPENTTAVTSAPLFGGFDWGAEDFGTTDSHIAADFFRMGWLCARLALSSNAERSDALGYAGVDLGEALLAVEHWYSGEEYHIDGIVQMPDERASISDYEQSEFFTQVSGLQTYGCDDISQGNIWFELPNKMWLQTVFYA